MNKNYNPVVIAELTKRVGNCLSIMTGAAGTPNNISRLQPSPQELVFMYNALGEMVHGLLDMDPKEISDKKPTNVILGMYLVNDQCPRCKNSEIELDHKFCMICGLPIMRE